MNTKRIAFFVLFFFSTNIFAASFSTLKVFSELSNVEIFVDEKHVGSNKAELNNLKPGTHYVKGIQNGVVVFSELISTPADIATTVLIKGNATPSSQKTLEGSTQYKEQQEYKRRKLDILLSKNLQTSGTSYTYGDSFPGYYSIFNSSWTKSSSTTYEQTDWKIIQGGIQQISDLQFAKLVNDLDTLTYYEKKVQEIEDLYGIGAILALTGIVVTVVGFSSALAAPTEDAAMGGILAATFGLVGSLIGLGMLSTNPPTGHFVSPSKAALQAYEYNQGLKTELGLPENYEP